MAPAAVSMTDVAKLNSPQHPGPTLWLNFDGGKGTAVKPFQTATTEQDIQEILFRTSEIFAPFLVHVQRFFGANSFDDGNNGNNYEITALVNNTGLINSAVSTSMVVNTAQTPVTYGTPVTFTITVIASAGTSAAVPQKPPTQMG